MRNDGTVIISTELDTKDFDRQIKLLENKLENLEDEYNAFKELKPFEGQDEELAKISKEIIRTKKELRQLNQEKKDFTKISGFEGIGNSISGLIRKTAKWGLAIFGVRSAYSFVRRSLSTISQYNEQIATDIQYINYAIATTLEPLIKGIIDLVYKLLAYVNYIANAWFGINLFANASAKSFNKANQSANALKRTLAGFDEINVLSNNSSGGGALFPSFDLSKIKDIPIPKWVKWIADHKDLFKMLSEVLLIAFGANTIAKVLSNIALLFGVSGGIGLIGLSEILLLIATPIVIYFTAKGIKKVIDETNKLNDAINANTSASEDSKKSHKEYIDTLMDKLKADELNEEQTKSATNFLIEYTKQQENMIKLTGEQETWLTKLTGSNEKVKQQYENMADELLQSAKAFDELTKAGKTTKKQQDEFYDTLYNNIIALEQAGVDTKNLRTEFEKISGRKFTVGINAGSSVSTLEKILRLLDEIFHGRWNVKIGIGYAGGGGSGSGFAKGGIVYHSLPKLASGGLINMPGRGVPIGSAIGGERGMEGVIPLTDSQQMALLGEAIGKYITINATVVNQMNGRVISRELQKVQNDSDFAFNR